MATDDHRVVFFERDVAEELLELVDDEPGQADEDLLDEAVEAIEHANGGLPSEAQQAVARGDAVAVGLEPAEVDSITTLINHNTEADKSALKSVGRSLQSKIRAARKKAKGRS
ncbi:MAG: hypothetical protein U5K30_02205 [Acidimicrobiales bacterium]|nr:hypothetical protein [Acidimicrobiales bacterium]